MAKVASYESQGDTEQATAYRQLVERLQGAYPASTETRVIETILDTDDLTQLWGEPRGEG